MESSLFGALALGVTMMVAPVAFAEAPSDPKAALSTGAIQPGRPEKKEAAPDAFKKAEAACMAKK